MPTYPSILRNSFPDVSMVFERTLSVLSSTIPVSHPSERQLLSDLNILLGIVSQQRQYCVNLSYFALHEEEEQQSTTRVGVRIVRSGVGRPRLDISEDLLEALHVTAGFRWATTKNRKISWHREKGLTGLAMTDRILLIRSR